MKNTLFLAAASVCLALTTLSPSGQAAQAPAAGIRQEKPTPVQNETLDFQLTNKIQIEGTSLLIEEIYLSPHSETEWGDNTLDAALDYGDTADVSFHPFAETICWDMAVKLEGVDEPLMWNKGFDLSQITKIELVVRTDGQPGAKTTPANTYGNCE